MLNDLLQEHDALKARIASRTRRIDEQLAPWEEQRRLLTTIPGIDRTAATTILIEIGPDIGVFASAECFAAWVGLCPGNDESGGKRRKTRTRPGSKTVRATLVECAHGATRTRRCQFEPATAPWPPGAATSAPSWPQHKMLRTIHVGLNPTITTAPLITRPYWSSVTPRAGSACSTATATSYQPNRRSAPPEPSSLTPPRHTGLVRATPGSPPLVSAKPGPACTAKLHKVVAQ